MVKPAGPYLDVIRRLAEATTRADRGVPGVGRARHAPRGRRGRRARPAARPRWSRSSRSAAPGRASSSPTAPSRSQSGWTRRRRIRRASSPRRCGTSPAGSTRRCGPCAPSGATTRCSSSRPSGAEVVDADGNRFVDYVASWGPMILGHAHPAVVEAVREAAARGTSYGAPTPSETDLAVRVKRAYPCVELLRFVSSGHRGDDERAAASPAARPGRDGVLKFAGCYHGHVDALLAQAGSGIATLGIPSTPGVPAAVAADTVVVPYNDPEALEQAFAAHGARLACAMVEGVPGNMGCIPPEPGFLELLRVALPRARRAVRRRRGDERLPRRRRRRGRAVRPRARPRHLRQDHGRRPAGGGLRRAAGARWSCSRRIGSTYQAGTLSGNPLAMAAGVATLDAAGGAGRVRPPGGARAPRLEDAIRAAPRRATTVTRQPRRLDADGVLPPRPGALVRRRRGG